MSRSYCIISAPNGVADKFDAKAYIRSALNLHGQPATLANDKDRPWDRIIRYNVRRVVDGNIEMTCSDKDADNIKRILYGI